MDSSEPNMDQAMLTTYALVIREHIALGCICVSGKLASYLLHLQLYSIMVNIFQSGFIQSVPTKIVQALLFSCIPIYLSHNHRF